MTARTSSSALSLSLSPIFALFPPLLSANARLRGFAPALYTRHRTVAQRPKTEERTIYENRRVGTRSARPRKLLEIRGVRERDWELPWWNPITSIADQSVSPGLLPPFSISSGLKPRLVRESQNSIISMNCTRGKKNIKNIY